MTCVRQAHLFFDRPPRRSGRRILPFDETVLIPPPSADWSRSTVRPRSMWCSGARDDYNVCYIPPVAFTFRRHGGDKCFPRGCFVQRTNCQVDSKLYVRYNLYLWSRKTQTDVGLFKWKPRYRRNSVHALRFKYNNISFYGQRACLRFPLKQKIISKRHDVFGYWKYLYYLQTLRVIVHFAPVVMYSIDCNLY